MAKTTRKQAVTAPVLDEPKPEVRPDEIYITVDHTIADILRYDQAGVKLHFVEEPGQFKELTDGEREQLSWFGRASYDFSARAFEKAVKEIEEPSFMSGVDVYEAARATKRLEVTNKQPGMHYAWKRPDEFRQAKREGYVVADEDALVTFGSKVGTTPTIGTKGEEDLFLMKRPQKMHDAMIRAVEEQSQRRVLGEEAMAASAIRAGRGLPIDSDDYPASRTGSEWSEAKSDWEE